MFQTLNKKSEMRGVKVCLAVSPDDIAAYQT